MTIRLWSIVLLFVLAVCSFAQDQASTISEIIVQGNQRVLKDVILAQMRTKVGQPFIQANLDRDQKSIEDLGFFSAVSITPTPIEGGNYRITVNVQEFPEIKEIRVVGNSAVKTQEILDAISLKPGQVFNLTAREQSREALRELYTRKGYFLGGIEEFGPMAESPGTINLVLVEAKVGTVSTQGNTRTKDWVMKRLIKTRPGETFSITKWNNDIKRLYNTQWFETVSSQETLGDSVGVVNLTAIVKEMHTGTFNVGLQLDPRSSLAGIVRLSEDNFRGTGQSVGIDFVQSTQGDGPSVSLSYSNPFIDNKDTTIQAKLYSQNVIRFGGGLFGGSSTIGDDFSERRTGGTLGLSRPVDDYLSLGVSARLESVTSKNVYQPYLTIGSVTINNPLTFIQQDGTVGVLSFGSLLNRRDTDIDPSRGDWLKIDLEPGYANITSVGGALTDQSLLGSHGFFRTNMEYRAYWSPGQPPRGRELDATRRVIAARIKVGNISGTVPFFEQFFVGGADSLRGYDEDRFWGKNALVSTVEYRHPIQKAFNAILFVDYGGAWGGYPGFRGLTQSSKFDLHLGYGFGLSFKTPLGPIRLDLGFDENGKSKTHFLIGTTF